VPKVKAGHVVPGIPLERVKKQLSEVMGALVDCPLVCASISLTRAFADGAQDFLIDQKEFVEGPEWKGLNPTLPVRI
jgi:phospholipase D1/2